MHDQRAAAEHVHATMRIVLLCATGVLQFGLSLRTVLEDHSEGRGSALLVFLTMACVPAACAWWVLRRRPLPTPLVAAGTLLVLAASLCARAALAPDLRLQAPDWSFGLVGWHFLLLLLDRVRALVMVLAVHLAASTALLLATGLPDRATLGAAGAAAFGATTVQLAVLVITGALCRRGQEAMAVAEERDLLATRVLTAQQWRNDQRNLFAGQLGATLPLLADLADGILDPGDSDTRRRCALAATQLRRLFAENDEVPDPLVHEVTACVDVAERRGMDVSFAISGAAVSLPAQVRLELTGPLMTALSAAHSRARVSLLRTEEEVRVAVIADARAEVAAASTGRVEVEYGRYGDFLRLEARWRKRQS
ncbi:hypothetical protein ACFVFD_08115 [Streptomyces fimicarius]|uniref:hypothetical protein n=1 Tax=Streptomyces griseus TaxID=1911 RepID=UPI00368C9F5B